MFPVSSRFTKNILNLTLDLVCEKINKTDENRLNFDPTRFTTHHCVLSSIVRDQKKSLFSFVAKKTDVCDKFNRNERRWKIIQVEENLSNKFYY